MNNGLYVSGTARHAVSAMKILRASGDMRRPRGEDVLVERLPDQCDLLIVVDDINSLSYALCLCSTQLRDRSVTVVIVEQKFAPHFAKFSHERIRVFDSMKAFADSSPKLASAA